MKREIDITMKIRQSLNQIKYLLSLLIIVVTFGMMAAVSANAEETAVNLEISQTIEALNTDRTDLGCRYILTAETEDAPMPEGAVGGKWNFTMNGENTSEKITVRFFETGEYHYQIRRDSEASETGYTYDDTVYHVVVFADYFGEGFSAEVKVHRGSSEDKVPEILFHHRYQPSGVCETDPSVKKVVEGTPSSSSVFEFTMTATDKTAPMPEGSADGVKTLQIEGSGEKEFGTVRFTSTGTWIYTISEVNTGVTGYTYDKMSYTLKCVVMDDHGILKLTENMTDASGDNVSEAVFTNTYKEPDKGGKTTPGGSSGSGGTVKTGDDTNLTGYMFLMLGAVVVMLCLAVRKRQIK